MKNILDTFDSVKIINIVDRTDRRREMMTQLRSIDAAEDSKIAFFEAVRPMEAAGFPSIGARGCFESHLNVLRGALNNPISSILIMEDDFDFSKDNKQRGLIAKDILSDISWDVFYGTHVLSSNEDMGFVAEGLAEIPPTTAVLTASFVAFRQSVVSKLVPFLTEMLGRPAGSPLYGPMHVDGAYSIFRQCHPEFRTLVAYPSIGGQRASRSDIASNRFLLDRFLITRPLANWLRRSRDLLGC